MDKRLLIMALVLFVIPIAYGIQVNSSTEIYSFNVENCSANTSTIGCSPADVRFSCDITPYAYIDYTLLRINGSDYTASRLNESFYYDWHKGTTPSDTDTNISFSRGQIHDIGGGDALFFPNISVHLLCDACNYNISTDPCLINNTQIIHYVGDGSPNCSSYNDTQSCDYCVTNWQINSTCLDNNTEFRQYEDENACYGITGLYSDSCGASFIDCDTWLPCDFLSDDMNCDFDINPLINIVGNKIYWKCLIGNNTETYNCISYVKQQGAIIQTSPQQTTYSSGIISKAEETREYFTAQNGLVQPYFTTENLKTNITYVFGVECSSPTGTLRTEEYITPMYRNLDDVAYRTIWVKDNLGYLIGGIMFLIIAIAIILLVVNKK
jgi:hypothetical protein